MIIQEHSTIQDIFDQFQTEFPYLKLEVYKKAHEEHHGSKLEDMIDHSTPLKKLWPEIHNLTFQIDEKMAVSSFEQMISDKLNLHIQVFRKSNTIWLQTTATDHWSLEKQNGKGMRSLTDYHIEPVEKKDFDLD